MRRFAIIPQAFLPAGGFRQLRSSTSSCRPAARCEDTARVSAAAAALLRKSPEVTDVIEFVGSSDAGDIRSAIIYVSLVPRSQRKMSQKQWEQRMMPLLNQVPDGHLNFSNGGGGRDVQLYLTGDDPPLVERTAHQLIEEMRGLNEIRAPRIRGDLPRPEIVVHPRLDIAAQLGVSVQSISQTIRIATLGDLPQNGAKFSLSDRQIPIRVSLLESARRDLSTLENLPVPTASGAAVPLKIGGGPEFRSGALGGAPLQPEPARLHRGGSEPGRGTRHRDQEDLRAADAQASAAGRAPGQTRRHRILRGDDAELRAGDRRRAY